MRKTNLAFTFFMMQFYENNVEVESLRGRLSSSTTQQYISATSSIALRFYSDSSVTQEGFEATFQGKFCMI